MLYPSIATTAENKSIKTEGERGLNRLMRGFFADKVPVASDPHKNATHLTSIGINYVDILSYFGAIVVGKCKVDLGQGNSTYSIDTATSLLDLFVHLKLY